jgi:hypothetical protein
MAVMGEEARTGVADGPSRRAVGEAPKAISSGGWHRQNVTRFEPEFDGGKALSKIKDEPTMLMKISNLKNDKMPDATILLNRKDLSSIRVNFIEM